MKIQSNFALIKHNYKTSDIPRFTFSLFNYTQNFVLYRMLIFPNIVEMSIEITRRAHVKLFISLLGGREVNTFCMKRNEK